MELQQTDVVWLDARCECSLGDLVQLSGLSEAELRELVDYGAVTPNNPQEAEWIFSGDIVVAIRAAVRLRDDLELDTQTLALALTLVNRIRDLEAQMSQLQAQIPHRLR